MIGKEPRVILTGSILEVKLRTLILLLGLYISSHLFIHTTAAVHQLCATTSNLSYGKTDFALVALYKFGITGVSQGRLVTYGPRPTSPCSR